MAERITNRTFAVVFVVTAGVAFWLGTVYERDRTRAQVQAELAECTDFAELTRRREPGEDGDAPLDVRAIAGQSDAERAEARAAAERQGLMPDGGPAVLIRAATIRRDAFRIVDEALENGSISEGDRAAVLRMLPELEQADQATLQERMGRLPAPPAP